mmetsp:Transcript_4408/g.10549  ORF Transcript_4408/g.10549 Transcript_4408/m.10549 type:complete len:512 (-) Transcript_4408:143-1678(-)
MIVSPVHDVVPKHGGYSWMRQNVGVANKHLVVRERPVPLGAACVMVVNEGDGKLRQPADETRRLAVAILQPPELGLLAGFLQDALRREVEGRRLFARGIHPVHQSLTMLVLVVAEPMVVVVHVRPEFPHSPGGMALRAVAANELSTIAFDEVEAPSIETNLESKPSQPDVDAVLDLRVPMVDVRRGIELSVSLAGRVHSAPVGVLVPKGDGPATPITNACEARPGRHSTGELVPSALAVLLVPAPVVDDDVGQAANAMLVALLEQCFQCCLGTVLGPIQVEELRWKVALWRHGLRAGRQPEICEAHVMQHLDPFSDDTVPVTSTRAPALPVKALQKYHLRWIHRLGDFGHSLNQVRTLHLPLKPVQLGTLLNGIELLHMLCSCLMKVIKVDEEKARRPGHFLIHAATTVFAQMSAAPALYGHRGVKLPTGTSGGVKFLILLDAWLIPGAGHRHARLHLRRQLHLQDAVPRVLPACRGRAPHQDLELDPAAIGQLHSLRLPAREGLRGGGAL